MELTDFIMQYVRDEICEKIQGTEDFQAAKEQKNTTEREFVMSLTKKQRRMFHEYIRQKDAMTAVELAHFLKGCTLVVSVEPRPR